MEPLEKPHGPNRRNFISSLAAGATTIGISSLIPPLSMQAGEKKTLLPEDPEAWINRIQGKHKMVFDVTKPNGIYPFSWPRVFLVSNESTGTLEKDSCAVVVLRHMGIAYAFEHRLWEKYKFGDVFGAPDPATNKPSLRNPFWKPADGSFSVPGIGEIKIGINELQASGVLFCVCSTAIKVFSNRVANNLNLNADETTKDFISGIIPGIQQVPSGLWALGRAQEKGCAYIFAG